jgi:ubiquinone/menaquinone biosynthesis C-methylase UbiE
LTWLGRLYIWATYRLYHEFAWAYDAVSWLVSLGGWSGWRLSALNYLTGERILEIGFGTGELLSEMAMRGLEPVGLDVSPAMHRVTARKLARRALDAPRVSGLVQAMPFGDESFDSIVSTFPAGYILEPATLRETARVLSPPDPATGTGGGRLIVVGLVVAIDVPVWSRAMRFLFGVQGGAVLERFTGLAEAAGLHVDILEQGTGRTRLPVVVAERQHAFGSPE